MDRPLVFITYDSADYSTATRLSRALRHRGVRTWSEAEDLVPGQLWDIVMPGKLREADVILVLGGRDTIRSPSSSDDWYRPEKVSLALAFAANDETPVIPILLDDTQSSWLPFGLRRVKTIHGRSDRMDDVAAQVERLLDRTSAPVTAGPVHDVGTSSRLMAAADAVAEDPERAIDQLTRDDCALPDPTRRSLLACAYEAAGRGREADGIWPIADDPPEPTPALRVGLRLLRADSAFDAGYPERAARALTEDSDDPTDAAHMRHRRAQIAFAMGDLDGARGHLDDACLAWDRSPDRVGDGVSRLARAAMQWLAGTPALDALDDAVVRLAPRIRDAGALRRLADDARRDLQEGFEVDAAFGGVEPPLDRRTLDRWMARDAIDRDALSGPGALDPDALRDNLVSLGATPDFVAGLARLITPTGEST